MYKVTFRFSLLRSLSSFHSVILYHQRLHCNLVAVKTTLPYQLLLFLDWNRTNGGKGEKVGPIHAGHNGPPGDFLPVSLQLPLLGHLYEVSS